MKIILCVLFFIMATPAFADLLVLTPEETKAYLAKKKKEYEEDLAKCPKDKPLYFSGRCHSCSVNQAFSMEDYQKCAEICPIRETYNATPSIRRCRLQPQYNPDVQRTLMAAQCRCPNSHPLYGRKKDGSGQVIELCHSCNTPEKLPWVPIGYNACAQSRSLKVGEYTNGDAYILSELQPGKTADTSTVPCQSKSTKTGK